MVVVAAVVEVVEAYVIVVVVVVVVAVAVVKVCEVAVKGERLIQKLYSVKFVPALVERCVCCE